MAIPTYKDLMLPLLRMLEDGQVWSMRKLTDQLDYHFNISPEDREHRIPSGQQTTFSNRVAWAKTYLKAAGLLENPKRGQVCISEAGRALLKQNPMVIDNAMLEQYPSFIEFRDGSTGEPEAPATSLEEGKAEEDSVTPLELLEGAYQQLRQALASDLLERLKSCSPEFFEKAVLDLLLAMGYGGVSKDGSLTAAGADAGIDGVIKEDKLGLDVVCVQAKRYTENSVGRPIVQAFVGSMDYHRAKKGVILTTSQFSSQAHDFVKHIEGKKVVLIGGQELAKYMIEHGVGIVPQKNYVLAEVSDDYFDQDTL